MLCPGQQPGGRKQGTSSTCKNKGKAIKSCRNRKDRYCYVEKKENRKKRDDPDKRKEGEGRIKAHTTAPIPFCSRQCRLCRKNRQNITDKAEKKKIPRKQQLMATDSLYSSVPCLYCLSIRFYNIQQKRQIAGRDFSLTQSIQCDDFLLDSIYHIYQTQQGIHCGNGNRCAPFAAQRGDKRVEFAR